MPNLTIKNTISKTRSSYIKIALPAMSMLLWCTAAFSQAPNIYYSTPQTYTINTPITPLTPNNTGGAVPATIYGQVSTFAGGRAPVTFDGTGTGAGFNFPSGINFSSTGIIYVSDYGSGAIRAISPATVVTTVATIINTPSGLVVDSHGNIFVTDFNAGEIFKVAPNGAVTVFAGSGSAASVDGTGTGASFNSPGGIAIDAADNLYVADQQGNKIRMITPAGVVKTIAGNGSVGAGNSPVALTASFNNPDGVAVDRAGNLYIADTKNNLIRKITPAGVVSTLAGSGAPGGADGTGAAASFNYPTSVTVDGAGNLYVTDFTSSLIRKITPAGVVTTIAGSGASGTTNGIGKSASFNAPLGSTIDADGNLYITDAGNYIIRKIILTGYTINKALPPGLTFDPTTGIITGTPTSTWPPTDYTITAYNKSGSSSATVNIQVSSATLLPSIITFPTIKTYTTDQNDNITPGATSTNKETPITYTSSNPAVAIVTPDGLLHLLGPGTTNITAMQNGDANYSPATPVTIVLVITEDEEITFPAISLKTTCDADFSAEATSNVTALPLTYTSSNPSVATISSQGLIHIAGAGTTTITVSQAGNVLYNPANPQSQLLTVELPVAPIVSIAADPTSICAGMPITYTATVSNYTSNLVYQWRVNGTNVGTNSNTFTSTTIAATDNVLCVVTNNNAACPAVGTSNGITGIKVDPYTTQSIAITSDITGPVCSGTAITFTAASTNGGTSPIYQWQVNGMNAGANNSSFTSSSLADGDQVTCMLTNQGGACLTTLFAVSNSINIAVRTPGGPAPSVTINASANNVYAGTPVTFTAIPADAGSNPDYQWQVNGVNAGSNSPTFTSSTLKNGDQVTCILSNKASCLTPVTSAPVIMNVRLPLTLHIPNAFTPNNDGINDLWNIPGLSTYPNCMVSIFTRYGSLIYQSKGYGKAWDGTMNGNALPAGAYYYIIDLANNTPKISGAVTLIK